MSIKKKNETIIAFFIIYKYIKKNKKKTIDLRRYCYYVLRNQKIKFSLYSLNTLLTVTSWRGPLPRHCAQAQFTVQCRTSGELMATCEKFDRPGDRSRVSHTQLV